MLEDKELKEENGYSASMVGSFYAEKMGAEL